MATKSVQGSPNDSRRQFISTGRAQQPFPSIRRCIIRAELGHLRASAFAGGCWASVNGLATTTRHHNTALHATTPLGTGLLNTAS
ncbi:hypothetical protein [Streptomyces peucetius]|uniref:Uncharacterized protein n=1 Tax=Streptomyces peucetius TaxID=1950 RepID=A0ABY6IF04_STRPE|nr:hypothetical protein [Streptomyces peucetius]UYQ65603.1 hypothetical protein OGH68_31850 [Streptomyces peucetius]